MYSHVLGIAGCAKSVLCKEILSASGGLGDDPPVNSLMGDLIKGMAQSNSNGRENMKLLEITELNDTARKGKVLCFPKTIVKYHNQNNATRELKLTIHRPMPCPSTLCIPLKELHIHILSSRQRNFDAIQHPSLGPPSHYSQDIEIILREIISERINQREIKWESSLSSHGESS
ncbi:Uncharacterized protein Adt_39288 [Abeliophyllum distichum]|uniref:Uncharacterized protein n=1 Tax=Abeliophyllum distichum TaxID=126358 RepID=A0ABD1Q4M8_9LAMI